MSEGIDARAVCEAEVVGEGTSIGSFSCVRALVEIGRDCRIAENVTIEGGARLGDRVTVDVGVRIGARTQLDDDVLVGPGVVFADEVSLRSRPRGPGGPRTEVKGGASLAANCTILRGVVIGRGARVGAGAVVTEDVPANTVVAGNPAVIVEYLSTRPKATSETPPMEGRSSEAEVRPMLVEGVRLVRLPHFRDLRGSLAVGDFEEHVPFRPARYFVVFDVPSRDVRGEHAHRECEQFLTVLSGSLSVLVDDGSTREKVVLRRPDVGLYVPPMVWASEFDCEPNTRLLVFASHAYDPDDYIRDYEDFLRSAGSRDGQA